MSTDPVPILEVRGLCVTYPSPAGDVEAVSELSLDVRAGECVGIVGESGAGKSQALLAVMGLLSPPARVRGSARFRGTELIGRPQRELNAVRGASLTMIFQDPLTSLTPHLTIGEQIAEPLVRHLALPRATARDRALELLESVRVTDPARRLQQFPHELSGGMRQRVMIATALACGPALVIADEPTTALDVTIQAQILGLLAELKRSRGMSMVLVTHDFGVVAGIADAVVVMRSGRVVERGPVQHVLKRPQHEYTRALLAAAPSMNAPEADGAANRNDEPAVLEVSGLQVRFPTRRSFFRQGPELRAVDEISLCIRRGEALGVVGESGSGKSTLARAILRLVRASSGQVVWLGRAIEDPSHELRRNRRDMQLVFQDPVASLNPRMIVREVVAEPLRTHCPELDAAAREQRVTDMLARVGLGRELLARYPHQLSGGQAQRVGIARAMILRPQLLVCDEAVSALDVSVQAQIVALLQDLKREFRTSILFISHNLAVVGQLCERVLVLYLGRMMEQGATADLYREPSHPYTRGLLDAVPIADPDLAPSRLVHVLGGEQPSPLAPPAGCVFHTRCPHAVEVCRSRLPTWEAAAAGREVACHRWRELTDARRPTRSGAD